MRPEFYSVVKDSPAKVVWIKSFTDKDMIREQLTEVLKELGFLD